MSKKLCKENDKLSQKIEGSKKKYICTKCGNKSPKEKWCCKPEKRKQ